ncbi:glycosyltransferase family 2 protein [Niveibacterium terrae]|uniref:glycosyltransferase family 2 protein n=1 Tax=Niveibacterium terrae TaxID=3373598 RepID=UPI003A8E72A7
MKPVASQPGAGHDPQVSGDPAPRVSVIVVNYNGLGFLADCIDSIERAFEQLSFEIVVVDNASCDGSQQWLRERADIVYLESPENLGFTGGNNLGALHARAEKLLFINNDTRVESRLDGLIDLLDDPTVGIAGCRLLYGDGRQQFSIGFDHTPIRIFLSWLGLERFHRMPSLFRRQETDPSVYRQAKRDCQWVSGACFAIRADVWRRLEGFDTRFFMYCEDVDLCLRIRQFGLRVVYSPQARVTHFEGAGKSWVGPAALRRSACSYLLFVRKHYGAFRVIALSLALGSLFLIRALAFALVACIRRPGLASWREKASGYRDVGLMLLTSLGRVRPEWNR